MYDALIIKNSNQQNKRSTSQRQFVFIFAIISCIISTFVLPNKISVIINFLALIIFAISGWQAYCKNDRKLVSCVITLPLFFSAFQNLWLGVASYRLDVLSLQILLSSNFLLEILLIVIYVIKKGSIPRCDKYCITITLLLTFQGMILYVINPTGISAFISSYRNIVSCIIIFWVSTIYSERADIRTVDRILFTISWCVVLFGILEYIVGTSLWKTLNIERLWNLKGIGTNLWGIPRNWYSSEKIGGQQLRRMVSTFADPVNLGTYLFSAFMYAWYKKKRVLGAALVLCCLLTISKGALLGFLIFAVIFSWYKDKAKILPTGAIALAAGTGMYFISFSQKSSTGSLFAHINGFFSSFKLMLLHPLGYGIGRIGVLSKLFSDDFLETSVTETGIGMIMAQLGVVGLIAYIVFFTKLIQGYPKLPNNNNERILYYTLIVSFIANAMFNEVALSPNSCILYFLILGIMKNSINNFN